MMASIDIASLVDAANSTKEVFSGIPEADHTKALRLLIDRAELVIGLYIERGEVKTYVIKGEAVLTEISRTGGRAVSYRAIHVREAEGAEAMRRTLGDGARLH